LIAAYGYSTYGGNSHIIVDANEAWVVIEFAGGAKLWVAERLGDDTIRASRPGHIGEIPSAPDDNFRFPHHFIDFAIDQGWHVKGERFDVNAIYGDGRGIWEGARWIETEMGRRAQKPEKITLEDMFWAIRTPRLTGDTAGYGQVVPLVEPSHPALRMIWHAPVGAVAAPFMPVFLGITEVAEEYRQHRYLTSGEHARFMDTRHALGGRTDTVSAVPQGIEATRSAVAICKRLLYLALRDAEASIPELERIFVAHERRLTGLAGDMQDAAGALIDTGRYDLAVALITYFSNSELRAGLRLVEQLADGLDARIRAFGGFDTSPEPKSYPQIW
jgi:dipeptidase